MISRRWDLTVICFATLFLWVSGMCLPQQVAAATPGRTLAGPLNTPIIDPSNMAQLRIVTILKVQHLNMVGQGFQDQPGYQLVNTINFSPDNKLIAFAGDDTELWDVTTGELKSTFNAKSSVSFSPDGRLLALIEGNVELRDLADGHSTMTLSADPFLVNNSGQIASFRSVTFSPDGKLLATGASDGSVHIWDVTTGEHKSVFRSKPTTGFGYYGPVSQTFSPDGAALAVMYFDNTLDLWDVSTGSLKATIRGGPGSAFSPDGKILASPDGFDSILMYDAATANLKARSTGHMEAAGAVAFSPDGKLLASAGIEGTLDLWDTATEQHRLRLAGSDTFIEGLAFSPDGKLLASISGDGLIRLWAVLPAPVITSNNLTSLRMVFVGNVNAYNSYPSQDNVDTNVAFSPDGKLFGATSDDNFSLEVAVWDSTTGQHKADLDGYGRFAFSPDGKLAASVENLCDGADCPRLLLSDVNTGRVKAYLYGNHQNGSIIAISPDGKLLAINGLGPDENREPQTINGSDVELWDLASGQLTMTLPVHTNKVDSLLFSPDSKILVVGNSDGFIQLWDATRHQLGATLLGHHQAVTGLALSADGKLLASASADQTIHVWDMATRQSIKTLTDSGPVKGVAFSHDSNLLASAGPDTTVRLWDLRDGKVLANLAGDQTLVTSVAFSPDGTRLAAASVDGEVRLWAILPQ